MPDRPKMYPNLVGPARLESRPYERALRKACDSLDKRHRVFSCRIDGHEQAIVFVPRDWAVNFEFVLFNVTGDHREVTALSRLSLHLFGQIDMGPIGLCHDHQTSGLFIQTMHNTWAECPSSLAQLRISRKKGVY